jgi:hypothetical protein
MDVFAAGLEYGAQNIAPDAPESVDSHANRHETLLSNRQNANRGSYRRPV